MMEVLVIILIIVVVIDILQRGRSTRTIRETQKQLSSSIQNIEKNTSSFSAMSKKIEGTRSVDISFPSKDPIGIEEHLYWLAEKICHVGFTSEREDETLDKIQLFLQDLYGKEIERIGELESSGRVVCAMKFSEGHRKAQKFPYRKRFNRSTRPKTASRLKIGNRPNQRYQPQQYSENVGESSYYGNTTRNSTRATSNKVEPSIPSRFRGGRD